MKIKIRNPVWRFLAGAGVLLGGIALAGSVLIAVIYGLGRLGEPIFAGVFHSQYENFGYALVDTLLMGLLLLCWIIIAALIALAFFYSAKALGHKFFNHHK